MTLATKFELVFIDGKKGEEKRWVVPVDEKPEPGARKNIDLPEYARRIQGIEIPNGTYVHPFFGGREPDEIIVDESNPLRLRLINVERYIFTRDTSQLRNDCH